MEKIELLRIYTPGGPSTEISIARIIGLYKDRKDNMVEGPGWLPYINGNPADGVPFQPSFLKAVQFAAHPRRRG